MKTRIRVRCTALVLVMASFALTSLSMDGRERIRFAKGATSATLKRVISGNDGVTTFIFRARKGQRVHFTVEANDDLGIQFSKEGDQDYLFESGSGEPNEYRVVATGDHFITVINRNPKTANITLRINIK